MQKHSKSPFFTTSLLEIRQYKCGHFSYFIFPFNAQDEFVMTESYKSRLIYCYANVADNTLNEFPLFIISCTPNNTFTCGTTYEKSFGQSEKVCHLDVVQLVHSVALRLLFVFKIVVNEVCENVDFVKDLCWSHVWVY